MNKHETAAGDYRLPDTCSNMTIHHAYGLSEPRPGDTIAEYFARNNFALLADLYSGGLAPEAIETAVRGGEIEAAPWPEKTRTTDLFWGNNEPAKAALGELADRAVQLCYGQNENQPVGGTFVSVGAELGSQQLALAGLIYGRVQGLLREIVELDGGEGPLYVARGSFSAQMFDVLLPEKP